MTTLKILGKTIDEYWVDVAQAIEQDREYWKDQLDKDLEAGNITPEEWAANQPI
jgi:hypothetical protein